MSQASRLDRFTTIFNWAAAIMLLVTLLMIFFFAPTERTMGHVQRIFYFHVGSAWVAAVAFFMALLGGVMYLRRPSRTWDTIAVASVEIGLAFTTMTIVSGSVWGRPAWNTWWIWSPRLTSITVMWLVYVAYFMLRGALDDEGKRGRFSAVYVIAGFVTVIITFLSIRFLRDIHPVLIGEASADAQGLQEFAGGLESAQMGITVTVSTITFSVLYVAWLLNRLRLQRMLDEASALKMKVMARLQGS
ncbi:MAG TPA: cytochrome c biogenesis protein CcsA [Candidatus Sulfomarinibacteraceae bacterium]|nr:cytochrome c biogenesis protein CcsA [Candidatus Sulfomarinibacteraceae bacterium]